LVPGAALAAGGDDQVFTFFEMDQNEVRVTDDDEGYAWEAQGWVGTDFDKAFLKTKGELEFGGDVESAEVQLLYSRLVSDFFDVQAGLRYDFEPRPSRAHAVLGLQGLAPQWFEIDTALFISDEIDVTGRIEGEYDLLITQRTVLQSLVELDWSAQDIDDLHIGSGLTKVEAGLRLRYEFKREIAPYIGVSYERDLFKTADFAREEGHEIDSLAFVIGLRLFF
jgi:copper resistance protein B